MKRILWILLLCCLWAAPARSQTGADLFRIPGIEVDVTAQTAAQARQIALEEVRARAFQRLLRRLTQINPRAGLADLPPDRVESLIQGLLVEREDLTDTQYIARYTVQFRPDAVRALFEDFDVRYSEAVAAPHLVVPVLLEGGAIRLWQADNPWAAALQSDVAQDRLIPYQFVPKGRGKRLVLSPPSAAALDEGALAALANVEDVPHVAVMRARPRFDPELQRHRLDYDYHLWPQGSGGQGWVVVPPDAGLQALYLKAAERIYDRLDSRQAARTQVRGGSAQAEIFSVTATDLQTLVTMRSRLEALALVRQVRLVQVSLPVSQIQISYLGDTDQLSLALLDVGVQLHQGTDGAALTLIASQR